MNRRQALKRLGLFAAAPFLDRVPCFDLHCHPGAFQHRGRPDYKGDQSFASTIAEMRAGGLSSSFVSIVADTRMLSRDAAGRIVPSGPLPPGETWADCERQLKDVAELAKREKITLVTGTLQMQALQRGGKLSAFLSSEGGHGLEGKLARLDDLYQRGVRSLQIAHYAQDTLGDLQTLPPYYKGLSAFGRDVVRRMAELKMLVDVAHASFDTVKATVDLAAGPIMLSHTHLQSQTSPHPRLITPDHARLVASTGGLIGAWPSGFANKTFADFVDQTMRLIDVAGIDHVGLGTDMDGNFQPVLSSYRQLPEWLEALSAKGLSPSDLAKVAGGNAIRVLGRVLKA